MRRGEFSVYWFCPSSQLRVSRELLAVLCFFAPVVAASKYPRAASTAPAPMISGSPVQNFLIRIAAGGVLPFRNPNPLSRDRRVPTLIPLPSLTESKRLLDCVPNMAVNCLWERLKTALRWKIPVAAQKPIRSGNRYADEGCATIFG
jgi:hypothetical protein